MNFFKNLLFRKNNQPADFNLYYRKLCHDCDSVKEFMEKNKLSFDYIDCEGKDSHPPVPIMATPALFVKGELVAYGTDIIHYLEKSQ